MVRKRLLNRYIGYIKSGCNSGSKLRLAIIMAVTNHIVLSKAPPPLRKLLITAANRLSQGVTTNVHGLEFKMVDWESCYICTPLFEDWSCEYVQRISEGDVFVDVGAHIGRYALPVARTVGEKGLVIAVEASARNYGYLKENIRRNKLHNVIAINAAAWSENKRLRFYPGETSGRGTAEEKTGDEHIEVNGVTLDTLLPEVTGGARISWLKIDVQGAELEVLKGLRETLTRDNPKLLVEVTMANRNGFESYMRHLGYAYHIISDSTPTGTDEIYYYGWRSENVCEAHSRYT